MSDPKGFLKYKRETPQTRPVKERITDFKEIYQFFSEVDTKEQANRCMDCGVPFCHSGCPLGNIIPDFNEAVSNEEWELAFEILSKTNNFPEFTGRICPAPCESACVLGINQDPVAIEHIEKTIAEEAFKKGWVRPKPPTLRTGKQVAVIGSGPAGLAAAAQLNKSGHQVTVFERNDRIGGLLRYGIPDFKLEKWVLERRIAIMEAEGIRFETNANVGVNIDPQELKNRFDALVLCGGSTIPRDLHIPGRGLDGVHFAMDYLEQNNRKVAGAHFEPEDLINVHGKSVVVIGGGDTGADCVGTSNRLGAKTITQLELMVKPPNQRAGHTPWPLWPMQLRTSSSHDEGCDRKWAILTNAFLGDEKGHLRALEVVDVEWKIPEEGGRPAFVEVLGSKREIPCDHCFLAIGFMYPQFAGLLQILGVEVNKQGNVVDQNYHTSVDGVFVAGDMRRGQSLVVWAISEGREAARSVDRYLLGTTALESKTASLLRNYG
ncbi:MAG: glutamate synthase subunit beta [Bacteroidota bacterium]